MFSPAAQAEALVNLTTYLASMPAEDKPLAVTMPDLNRRNPLMLAAMNNDVAAGQVLWAHGANEEASLLDNDLDGYTALMLAIRLGHTAFAQWLYQMGVSLLDSDEADLLAEMGVTVSAAYIQS